MSLFKKKANVLFILLIDPILFSGSLTILDCSASACNMDCLIHQTAYEINLKPLVSSNLLPLLSILSYLHLLDPVMLSLGFGIVLLPKQQILNWLLSKLRGQFDHHFDSLG